MKTAYKTTNAPEPIGPYSQVIIQGDLAFLSGQVAIDPKTGELVLHDLEKETTQVMENIGAVLREIGVGFENVLKASIFLSDMDNFAIVNQIYGSYFNEPFPARECVEVSRLPKDVNVEITIIAMV